MQTRVQKWGDGLAVKIPESLAALSHLEVNSVVDLAVENGRIVMMPVSEPGYALAQMLDAITTKICHGEIRSDGTIGHESW